MINPELAIQELVRGLTESRPTALLHAPRADRVGSMRATLSTSIGPTTALDVGPRALPFRAGSFGAVIVAPAWLDEEAEPLLLEVHRSLEPAGLLVIPLPSGAAGGDTSGVEELLRRFFPHVIRLALTPSWCWTIHDLSSPASSGAPLRDASLRSASDRPEPWGELLIATRRPRRMGSPLHVLTPASRAPGATDQGAEALVIEVDRLRREALQQRRAMIEALQRGDDLFEEAAVLTDRLTSARQEVTAAQRQEGECRNVLADLTDQLVQAGLDREELQRRLDQSLAERRALALELEARRAEANRRIETDRRRTEVIKELRNLVRRQSQLRLALLRLLKVKGRDDDHA